jgi:hypothetical protein
MIDLFIVSGSAALGLISAVLITRYATNRKNSNPTLLGNVKNELNNIEFEKSVALEALGKIDQFFKEKKIDEFERDRLAKKYNNILDEYDKRIFQLTPILEAQEIYEYRKELNSIVSEYTKKIDARLKNLTGISPNSYEYLNKGVDKATVGNRATGGADPSSKWIPDSNKSESLFSKFASLKLNPKKNNKMFLEKELPLQNDKVTQSEFVKNTVGDKSNSEGLIKKDKPNQYLLQNNKINTSSTSSSSNPDKTSYTSIKAIDSTPNAILPPLLSANNQDDKDSPHPSVSIKDSKENSKQLLDTGNEIEKIQSDILKTLRRLEDHT